MNTEFASADFTAGQLNAIVKKLGGPDMALRFLRDELVVSEHPQGWAEEGGVIYLSVRSDGTSGKDWVPRLENQGFEVEDLVKKMLLSHHFQPTTGVVTNLAIFRGEYFPEKSRLLDNAFIAAKREGFGEIIDVEVACLLREKISERDLQKLGLNHISVMRKPASVWAGSPDLINVRGKKLSTCGSKNMGERWSKFAYNSGIAFGRRSSNG